MSWTVSKHLLQAMHLMLALSGSWTNMFRKNWTLVTGLLPITTVIYTLVLLVTGLLIQRLSGEVC